MNGVDDGMQPEGPRTRVVLEVAGDGGSVHGTLTTSLGSRPFWGWLELMSELERATDESGAKPGTGAAGGRATHA